MLIRTPRLRIRDVDATDEIPFAEMAADGSLKDIGFDKDCGRWLGNWIKEAKEFAKRNNPYTDYIAHTAMLNDGKTVIGSVGCSYYEDLKEIGICYFVGASYRNNGYAVEMVTAYIPYFFKQYGAKKIIATIREENIFSWKVVEKAGFSLIEKKMYKDINDQKEELYRFYEKTDLE